MPIIPAVGRVRKEDQELKASLGYIVSLKSAWTTWQDPPQTNKKLSSSLLLFVRNNV
jgi:hypothetical protein